jgi:hypothetical protein
MIFLMDTIDNRFKQFLLSLLYEEITSTRAQILHEGILAGVIPPGTGKFQKNFMKIQVDLINEDWLKNNENILIEVNAGYGGGYRIHPFSYESMNSHLDIPSPNIRKLIQNLKEKKPNREMKKIKDIVSTLKALTDQLDNLISRL